MTRTLSPLPTHACHARRRYRRALIESLEPRTLLSVTPVPFTDGFVASKIIEGNNTIWAIGQFPNDAGPSLAKVVNGTAQNAVPIPAADISGDISPSSLVWGNNGHIYITDFNGAIQDFNISTSTFAPTFQFDTVNHPELTDLGTSATVTSDGGLWWVGEGTFTSDPNSPLGFDSNSFIIHYDTNTQTLSEIQLNAVDPSLSDAAATFIAPRDASSVYVAVGSELSADAQAAGSNHIATVAYSAGNLSLTGSYVLATNSALDHWPQLQNVSPAADGTLWLGLQGTDPNQQPQPAVSTQDTLLHVAIPISGNQLVTLANISVPGNQNALQFITQSVDSKGRVWFTEAFTNSVGYFDPTASPGNQFVTFPAPAAIAFVSGPQFNSDASLVTFLGQSFDDQLNLSSPLVQIDFPAAFSGSANLNGNLVEDTSQTLTANFSAPAPAGGTYHATIHWGDGSPDTIVNATAQLGNNFTLTTTHSFAAQGTYNITVTIADANSTVGVLPVNNVVISDIPLTVTSFNVVADHAKDMQATLTFTDDPDSSPSWYTISLNWGDGTVTSAVAVRTAAGQYIVIATHKYKAKKPGTTPFTVTATVVSAEDSFEPNAVDTTVTVQTNILV